VLTRLTLTCAAVTAALLKRSLPSTLGVLPPVTGEMAGVPKASSTASTVFAVMTNVAVAVEHTALFGAGRQTW